MKDVFFFKAGNPYGYGYSAGEVGKVYDTDQIRDTGRLDKKGNPITEIVACGFKWLEQNNIVRAATSADLKAAAEKEAARVSRTVKKGEKSDENPDEKA